MLKQLAQEYDKTDVWLACLVLLDNIITVTTGSLVFFAVQLSVLSSLCIQSQTIYNTNMTNLTTHMGEDLEWTNLLKDMAQHIGGLPSTIRGDIFEYLGEGLK